MITPGIYEDEMQSQLELSEKGIDVKRKIIIDTVEILKQFGYDKGAEIFQQIITK